MEDLKNTAKSFAPKDTGELKESIIKEPVKKVGNTKTWKVIVGAPHRREQDEGFSPHPPLLPPIDAATVHKSNRARARLPARTAPSSATPEPGSIDAPGQLAF